jgi:hypothetical protein
MRNVVIAAVALAALAGSATCRVIARRPIARTLLSQMKTKAKLTMTVFKQILAFSILAGIGHVACQPAHAGTPRRGVDTRLTKQRRVDYRKLVAESLNQNVKPSTVDVYEFMQAGTWTMVYATVPVADPGYFFFDSSAEGHNLKMSGEGSHKKVTLPRYLDRVTSILLAAVGVVLPSFLCSRATS